MGSVNRRDNHGDSALGLRVLQVPSRTTRTADATSGGGLNTKTTPPRSD